MKRCSVLSGIFFGAALLLWQGCATTKYVPQGSYLLHKNKIEVEARDGAGPLPAGRSLLSFVRQKPNTSVFFGQKLFLNIYSLSGAGDNGFNRMLRKVGEAPVLYDSELTARSKTNIDTYLISQGFYSNQVTDTVAYVGKKASVTYRVRPGVTYTVDSVTVHIEDPVIDSIYRAHANKALIGKGSVLSTAVLEEEVARVNLLLRNNGYYDFNKNYVTFSADTLESDGTARLDVWIDTRMNTVYRLRTLRLYPNYDPIMAEMDSQYERQFDTTVADGLQILYQKRPLLRPRFLSKINRLQSGQVYAEQQVKSTYNRFSSINLYNGITMLFDKVPEDSSLLDCTLRLNPGKTQGYQLNLEASSNSNGLIGVSPALEYSHKNIFHGGEWLTVGFMGNFQFKFNDPIRSTELGASLGLSLPQMLFPVSSAIFTSYLPRTEISASYNYQSRPEYTRNIASTSFGYTWRMAERFNYTVTPMRLKLVKMNNLSDDFVASLTDPFLIDTYRDHLDLGLSALLYYTTDASAPHKRNYFYLRTGMELSGNVLSAFNSLMKTDTTGSHTIAGIAYSQYVKCDVNTAYTWVFDTHHQFAARLYAGIGIPYGNANAMPLEQMFYSGGANSLRGWQARTVGPGSAPVDSTFRIPNQSGNLKIEANLEYRFPLFWKMEGAVFADAGNIWTLQSSHSDPRGVFRCNDFYKSIAVDAGLGLRMNLDFVIVRLDLGMIMRDPVARRWVPLNEWLSKDKFSVQFGVGYPF